MFFDNGEPIRSDDFPDNGAILANFKNTEVSEFFRHSNEPVLIKMRKDLDESRCKTPTMSLAVVNQSISFLLIHTGTVILILLVVNLREKIFTKSSTLIKMLT